MLFLFFFEFSRLPQSPRSTASLLLCKSEESPKVATGTLPNEEKHPKPCKTNRFAHDGIPKTFKNNLVFEGVLDNYVFFCFSVVLLAFIHIHSLLGGVF